MRERKLSSKSLEGLEKILSLQVTPIWWSVFFSFDAEKHFWNDASRTFLDGLTQLTHLANLTQLTQPRNYSEINLGNCCCMVSRLMECTLLEKKNARIRSICIQTICYVCKMATSTGLNIKFHSMDRHFEGYVYHQLEHRSYHWKVVGLNPKRHSDFFLCVFPFWLSITKLSFLKRSL